MCVLNPEEVHGIEVIDKIIATKESFNAPPIPKVLCVVFDDGRIYSTEDRIKFIDFCNDHIKELGENKAHCYIVDKYQPDFPAVLLEGFNILI